MAQKIGVDIEADLQQLDAKLKMAKLDYEQFFLGNRPREPIILRQDIQKIVNLWSNLPIRNTAHRFRFNTLTARFFSLRRQWDEILRKIEAGTYEPLKFKLEQKDRLRALQEGRGPDAAATKAKSSAAGAKKEDDLFEQYADARMACGQGMDGIDRTKLKALLDKQEQTIRAQYNCAKVNFRVVVENGKAKLKATPVYS